MAFTPQQLVEIMSRYKETGDKKFRNDLVIGYSNVVKYAVISTRNMYQKYADADDITSEGMLALMAAIDNFDPSKNVKFETYASIKVRGAIIDYIRKQDVIPRGVRKFSKEVDATFSRLFSEFGREPTNAEIASAMGITEEKLLKGLAASAAAASFSFEEMLESGTMSFGEEKESGGTWEVEKNLHTQERNKMLAKAIDDLNDQQRTVVSLYYYEQLRFSDIAKVMSVSESRVCQIHSKAMMKLRHSLESYIKA